MVKDGDNGLMEVVAEASHDSDVLVLVASRPDSGMEDVEVPIAAVSVRIVSEVVVVVPSWGWWLLENMSRFERKSN